MGVESSCSALGKVKDGDNCVCDANNHWIADAEGNCVCDVEYMLIYNACVAMGK